MRRIMRNVTIFLLLLSVHVSASTKKPDDRQSVYQRYAGQYILGGVPDDITALSSKFVGQYDKIPVCGICNSIATTTSTMNPYKCMRKNRDHVVHGACFKNLYENQSDVNSLQCPKCKAGLKYKFKKSNWWSKNWQKLDSQGRKIYEGEMRDFQYHGKGKLFDPFDPLNQSWFEGKFSNGVRNGKGKEYWDDDHKLWFKGNYKDGKKDGYGTHYYNGRKKVWYAGDYMKGRRHGSGTLYHIRSDGKQMQYDGKWKNGRYHGYGKLYRKDGSTEYVGNWINGRRQKQ
eukprot:195500_1